VQLKNADQPVMFSQLDDCPQLDKPASNDSEGNHLSGGATKAWVLSKNRNPTNSLAYYKIYCWFVPTAAREMGMEFMPMQDRIRSSVNKVKRFSGGRINCDLVKWKQSPEQFPLRNLPSPVLGVAARRF